ncbi:peptidoglycan DD-metalloendopeptidase family protein [Pseudoduganella ginsengisoli]|uniref:Peptidoglycan DD-metalloendopeptidase family protein n=1 Tax=Pseudoduganella ginsengisoli TaxID=1462440 RepID=A0A6L6Q6Z6_9BURK|nr:peptidoglycan DD-metalloendopeptidase family protein [Pseudoduganella ginsengisoli]MTW05375.1 peptidoglycan DD-metalloendopeptidase family protein [Pseudoduganella ginsengisoli]
MINKSSLLLLSITLGALSACTTPPQQAPVEDRYLKPAPPHPVVKPPAPSEDARKDRDERGLYTVKKGDSLIKIALEHGQNYMDIAAWNNLANPNDIKVDQVLRVLPPENGVVIGKVEPPGNTTPKPEPVVARKTSPRGDKKPYTEGALADMQKPDSDKPERPEKPAVVASVAPSVTPPAPAAPAMQLSAEDRELTWMWPSEGRVIATFDEGKNKGIDIAGKPGQHVMAAGAGKVMYAGSGIRGYGNLVIVKHSNSLLSAYAHNRAILVKEGQSVKKGEQIAEMGDSDTDAVKLHFEIRQQGKPVDPSKFLPNR